MSHWIIDCEKLWLNQIFVSLCPALGLLLVVWHRRTCRVAGRSYAISSQRTLIASLESVAQKCQSGVVIQFEKIGPDVQSGEWFLFYTLVFSVQFLLEWFQLMLTNSANRCNKRCASMLLKFILVWLQKNYCSLSRMHEFAQICLINWKQKSRWWLAVTALSK